jgi:hypothetical protein
MSPADAMTRRPRLLTTGLAAALGLLTVAWPLAWAPAWAYAAAGAGAVAALAGAVTGWRPGPAIAVAAAIGSCAFSRAGSLALTAEGLFILGYLLAAGAPAGLSQPGRWLRHQAFLGVPGLIASGVVLAALALHQATSAWLTVAGLAAAVAAYLIALPSWRRSRTPRLPLPDPDPGVGGFRRRCTAA